MGLQADLSVKLDASGLSASFTADAGDIVGALDAVDLPVDPATLQGAVRIADGIDLSDLESTAGGIGEALAAVAGQLPGAGDVLTSIGDVLDLISRLTDVDLETTLTTLIERLSAELENDEGGTIGAFIRLAAILKSAPQTAVLKDFYGVFAQVAGAPGLNQIRLPDLLPALAASVRTLGTLMTLETLLEETERLSGSMAAQLDVPALREREAALLARLEALPTAVAEVDIGDPAAVEGTARAIAEVQLELAAYARDVAEGMAIGEGTLVYIDFTRLKGEIDTLLGELRAEDMSAIERAAAGLAEKIAPLLDIDLSSAPRFALDDLLDQVEVRATDLATQITTADLSVITAPLTAGLAEVTRVPAELAAKIEDINLAVRSALEGVKRAVSEVPLGNLGDALRVGAGALADALDELTSMLGAIDAVVGDTAAALQSALDGAESSVDTLIGGVEAVFQDAATFVEGLDLDRVAGNIADNINAFSAVIAKANLSPYFSSATDVIDSTAGVVEKVPFSLLPDSMEEEVVAVARPIKQTDLDAFRLEILSVLQIGDDGTFTLRPELEAAVLGVQEKVDALLDTLREHDPAHLAAELAPLMDDVRARLQDVLPQVDLGPVREALDRARDTVAALDPAAALAPVNAGFDAVLAAVDAYDPAALLDGVESRIDEARDKVIDTIRLRTWREQLDRIETGIQDQLDLIDVSRLEDTIERALADARRRIEDSDGIRLLDGLGAFLVSMLAGRGRRTSPASFEAVADWLSGESAGAALEARAAAAFAGVEATRQAVGNLDPTTVTGRLTAGLGRVRAAIELKSDGTGKARLEASLTVSDPIVELARIGANRGRYLATLDSAATAAAGLRDLALGEADAAAGRLRAALAPFAPVTALARSVADIAGMSGSLDRGLSGIVLDLLDAAPPERLSAMLNPVYQAIRGRLEELLATVLDPTRQAIDDVLAALEAVNLDAVRDGLGAIHGQIRGEIEALRPDALLAEPLAAFADAQAAVQAFDPLGAVDDALQAVRDSADSVLAKLDPEALVATPQAMFDTILGAFEKLDIGKLLTPLFDQLDGIAAQVDGGLEDTVASFKRLQDALPDRVGSTSLTVSASVSTN